MVANVTSLTGNGLKDWLIQRVTALYFALYVLFLLGFVVWHWPLTFLEWQSLFAHTSIKIATIVALVAFSLHAWIGIWTVTTDYIKCTAARLVAQLLVLAWLLGQFLWGLLILWGQ